MKNRTYTLLLAIGLACGLLIATGFSAAAQTQNISTKNTSKSLGDDWWEWTVFIEGPAEVLKNVKCVEYKLDSTFRNPRPKVCRLGKKEQPFALTNTGWGTFDIPIKVVFKNGQTRVFKHRLIFESAR